MTTLATTDLVVDHKEEQRELLHKPLKEKHITYY